MFQRVSLALAIIFVLLSSHMGQMAVPTSEGWDWPWHSSEVEVYFNDTFIHSVMNLFKRAGVYPGAGYWTIATMARLFGINPLQSIQIIAGILTVLGSFLVA